jgi:hypothetical protein
MQHLLTALMSAPGVPGVAAKRMLAGTLKGKAPSVPLLNVAAKSNQ